MKAEEAELERVAKETREDIERIEKNSMPKATYSFEDEIKYDIETNTPTTTHTKPDARGRSLRSRNDPRQSDTNDLAAATAPPSKDQNFGEGRGPAVLGGFGVVCVKYVHSFNKPQ